MLSSSPDQRRRRSLCRFAAGAAVLTVGLAWAAAPSLASTPGSATAAPTSLPPLTVLLHDAGNASEGDFFLAPFGTSKTGTPYANGPEIVDSSGNVVWSRALPAGYQADDFRTQTYEGKPVLTWWQGPVAGGAFRDGEDIIADQDGNTIATVQAGDGMTTDSHEFLITPQNTALIDAHVDIKADLSSMGGPASQNALDCVVQEINIATGAVIFSWDAADHVPFSASEQALPEYPTELWDWFHLNSVTLFPGGSLLVNGRHTWAAYRVNVPSGSIQWTLGGKDSNFTYVAAPHQALDRVGDIFTWEHDAEFLGNDTYSFFDNDTDGTNANRAFSRAVVVTINPSMHVATLIRSYNQPEKFPVGSDGNMQTLSDGNVVVGWGARPYFSEFTGGGKLLENVQFSPGFVSYRAFRAPWPPPA
jgi:hypothetical protein